jgi:MinD-like ATPase involved in chromosome partitioning or flagellar assembly
MHKLLKDLEGYVILDCAPGFGKEVISSLDVCDEVVVVTNPLFPSVVGSMRVIEVARELGKEIRGIILNKVGKFEINPKEIEAITGLKVLGQIPYDRNVDLSIIARDPVLNYRPYSTSAQAYMRIASEMTGKTYKKPKLLAFRRAIDNLGLSGPKLEKEIQSEKLS